MKPSPTPRRRRASPRTARTAAVFISMAALALLTGACGGGGHTATTSATSGERGALAYARCMRSHGVPNFPDPNSSGSIDKAKVSSLSGSPRFRVAEGGCQHLLPTTGTPTVTRAEVQAALNGMVRFAACMRSHGCRTGLTPRWIAPTPPTPVLCSICTTRSTRSRLRSGPISTNAGT